MGMGHKMLTGMVVAGLLLASAAGAKVPFTGRQQFNLIPDALMRQLGQQTYASLLEKEQIQREGPDVTTLSEVGGRISRVAQKPKFAWKTALIRGDSVNAWCLPGGYIGFYTGILTVLRNEAGMAFVMGHEVGHAVARHGAERMSQRIAVVGGLGGLALLVNGQSKLKKKQKKMVLGALGVGATVGLLLPFSRTHESEADIMGMMYMAKAGYPPQESLKVWNRMAAQTDAGPPAFLSTHPASKKRKQRLRNWMPRANKRYVRNRLRRDTQVTLWSRATRGSETKQ